MIRSPENVEKACPATLSGDWIIVLRSTPTLSGHSIKHASSLDHRTAATDYPPSAHKHLAPTIPQPIAGRS